MQLEPQNIDLQTLTDDLHPLVGQCRKLLGKLDIICSEINGIENDIEEFLEEYYRRVSAYFQPIAIGDKRSKMADKPKLFQELSIENKGWARQEHRRLYLELINEVHPDRAPVPDKHRATKKTQKITQAYRENHIQTLWKEKFSSIVNQGSMSKLDNNSAIYDFYHNLRLYLTKQRIYLSRLTASEENQLRLKAWSARIEGVDLIQSIICDLQQEHGSKSEKQKAPDSLPALLRDCA